MAVPAAGCELAKCEPSAAEIRTRTPGGFGYDPGRVWDEWNCYSVSGRVNDGMARRIVRPECREESVMWRRGWRRAAQDTSRGDLGRLNGTRGRDAHVRIGCPTLCATSKSRATVATTFDMQERVQRVVSVLLLLYTKPAEDAQGACRRVAGSPRRGTGA